MWSLWNRSATLLLLLLVIAVVVDYCCGKLYGNMLLPMHTRIHCREYLRHTAATQIAHKLTRSGSVQVELGKVEGFRVSLKSQVNAGQPYKCKAASSLAA